MTKSKNIGRGGQNKAEIDLSLLMQNYQSGVPVEKLAVEHSVTERTIYNRLKSLGITKTNAEAHLGQKAWNLGLGHRIDSQGYRRVWVNGKQVREHRVVIEETIGRKLRPGEIVHHINGNRNDNDPSNLEVLSSQSEHMKHHAALKAVGVEV